MMRIVRFIFLWLVLAIAWFPALAADLVIYDNASENGFNQNCSFKAAPNFADTTLVHSAPNAISFSTTNFGAVSWCTPSVLSTTNYSGITFWVNGGASGGQNLQLFISNNSNGVASASLATLLGHAIAANTWVQVTASFDNAPMAFNGNFDQISIQSNTVVAQPTVYFDDVTLVGRVNGTDEIFRNSFESISSTATILIENSVACAGTNLNSERYTWHDASGWIRSATLSHNDTGANVSHEGELCDYTYHTDAVTVRDVQELTSGGAGGFGYIVSHLVYGSAAYNAAILGIDRDDSPLGHSFSGTFTRLLNGRHHAILRYQLLYPRWGENPNTHVATKRYLVPVTIDWLIATGRDHALWSVTYDLQGATSDDGLGTHPGADEIKADSRAPYGDMAFDGAGAAADFGGIVGGVAWGDHYKFTTTAAPMTLNSSWTWNVPNTIPYVYLWTNNVDAEMGIVQSEDIAKQDAGSEFSFNDWNTTSALTTGCPGGNGAPIGTYLMPCVDYEWAYQANADDTDQNAGGTAADKHLTWGTGYGFLGQTAYNTDGTLTNAGVGWPRQSYATYVVLGLHGPTPTDHQVTQVENAMSSTLSATNVVMSGPAGVNRTDTRSFQPAGYNRVYGTWDVVATPGATTLSLNAAGAGLVNPIFIIHSHTNALPSSVTLDGTALTADVDYFATVDPASADHADTRLWITVNRTWVGSHSLSVN
jgi:hypothetical protein